MVLPQAGGTVIGMDDVATLASDGRGGRVGTVGVLAFDCGDAVHILENPRRVIDLAEHLPSPYNRPEVPGNTIPNPA